MSLRLFCENPSPPGCCRVMPLLLAAMGELISERAGVLCLGAEGTMIWARSQAGTR